MVNSILELTISFLQPHEHTAISSFNKRSIHQLFSLKAKIMPIDTINVNRFAHAPR